MAKNLTGLESAEFTDGDGNTSTISPAGTTVTDGTNTTNYGAKGLTFVDTNGDPLANTPSITKDGIDAGDKKLTGVAAGNVAAGSTDAVNGDQLFQTQQAIDDTTGNIAKGINFGNGDSANNYQLGDTINVKGDDNVISTTTDDGVQLSLADNITVNSVKADDGNGNVTTLDGTGTTATDAAGNSSQYGAAGSTMTDEAGNKTITAADGMTVSDNSGNSTNYGAEGLTFVDPDTGEALAGTPSVTKDGIDAGDKKLTGVAAGDVVAGSTDAVNGDQLFQTNQAVSKNASDIANSVGMVSKGINFGNGSAANNYQLGDTINVKGDNNVTSTTTADGVQLGLADNITVKSVAAQTVTADDGKGNVATLTADGTTVKDAAGNTSNYGAAGSTVADKDGNKAVTAAKGVTVSNDKNSTVYGAEGMTFVDKTGTAITNAPSVTVQGINAGNQQITNVAEGRIEEGSTDAVNGGQLYNTNRAITQVANSVDELGYKLDGVQEEANAGISSAMAMASMPQAFLPGKSMISGGIATYNGEGAVAVGVSKLSDNGRWVIKINGSADTKGNAGAAAGVGMHW